MKNKIQETFANCKMKLMAPAVGLSTALMLSVPAFAAEDGATSATIDPALFDPLVDGVTGNVSAVMPKVLVVVGLLTGLGVVLALFKKHARPS